MNPRRMQKRQIIIRLAAELAMLSPSKQRKIGCVVVDRGINQIAAMSFNGIAKGEPHHRCHSDVDKPTDEVHAEVNALIKPFVGTGWVMVLTGKPCLRCGRTIVNHGGIGTLVYDDQCEGVSDEGITVLLDAGIMCLTREEWLTS